MKRVIKLIALQREIPPGLLVPVIDPERVWIDQNREEYKKLKERNKRKKDQV